MANLRRRALNGLTKSIVADMRCADCGCFKGERCVDGGAKYVPRLTDAWLACLQIRMRVGNRSRECRRLRGVF